MSGTRDDEKRVPDPESDAPHLNGAREELEVDMEPTDELGDIGALQAKLKKIRHELASVKKERQEYLDGWQRCKADTINQRRELESARERAAISATERLAESLIPALDSFDMAMGGEAWHTIDPAWRKGVESIHQQFTTALQGADVAFFGNVGDAYDPMRHEVLEEIDDEGEPGTVARVVRRGWMLGERVLRPAHVIIRRIAA